MSTSSSQLWETPAETSRKVEVLLAAVRAGWSTPPRLSLPAWADLYRHLPKGSGAVSGQWFTSAFEVSRGPMLAVTEPGVHKISLMCCTQLLKSEFLINLALYLAHLDPSPILILQPKEDAAEQFSKERLQPSIDATPVLRDLVGGPDETLTYKPFPGGFLALAGAGSADNVARRPIRAYLADEIDKYRFTREGNTLRLAEERTAQFGLNWLGVVACSPTVEEESLIAAEYEESDQRRASVECAHCGHRQFPEFFKHVNWPKREDAKGQVVEHLTAKARIHCEACGVAWSEGERLQALRTIRWHQTRPFECCDQRRAPLELYAVAWKALPEPVDVVWHWWEDTAEGRYAVYRAKCPTCGKLPVDNHHAGFHASKLLSPSVKDKPSDIAGKWLKSKGKPDDELVWWNTQMGLPHRPSGGKKLDVDHLLSRREVWPAEVHAAVTLITVGIDVQDYRVEMEVVGWGADEESWSIDYHVIEGEFSDPQTQAALDKYLKRLWRRADGSGVEVLAACIDSGGHHTQAVYAFSKARLGRRIWAVKGASEQMGQRNPVWPAKRPSKRSKASFRPVMVGGNAAMDTIRGRLGLAQPQPGQPAPGYMHFPVDRDVGYFQQLTASRLSLKEVAGKKFRVWETPDGKANEAEDCRKYAYAALCGLLHFGLQLNRRAMARVVAAVPEVEVVEEESEALAVPAFVPSNTANQQKRGLVARLA